jgi:hypothetical protein
VSLPAFIFAMTKERANFSSVIDSRIEENDSLPKEAGHFSEIA